MTAFTYYTPTKVIFENDAEVNAGKMLKEFGAKKVLIHYGSERVIKTGLMKKVTDSMDAVNIPYVFLGGVVPNPRITTVYEGIEIARKEGVDFILAVGGGSVIDSAKAIAVGIPYSGDVWDFFERKAFPASATPIGCVLTIPAAGSEMSNGMVITKEDGLLKRDLSSDYSACTFALLNPTLTLTLPEKETVNGVVDILMHTMERYFHKMGDFDINDSIAESLLKSVMRSARELKKDSQNMPARESMLWASSLAHNGLTGCGSAGGDWATHQIEHEVSGLFDVSHGAGLSTVWPSWARYVVDSIPHRFVKFATNVMGVNNTGNEKEMALEGINSMEKFFEEIGSPVTIPELIGRPATDDEIDIMADSGTYFGKRIIGSAKELNKDAIASILCAANK